MRVLILGVNYLPESTSIGPYTADLAEYLTRTGHDVLVVTGFPMAPMWSVWDGYKGKWFSREIINGVRVVRTYMYLPKNPKSAIQRVIFDTLFSISALVSSLVCSKRCDVIVVISPPLQLGVTGWILGFLMRRPFFLQIKDLVPDAAVATGMLSEDNLAVKMARKLEAFVYTKARGIGVICEGFTRNLVAKKVPPGKVVLLPDYIDLAFMRSHSKDNPFRSKHNLSNADFVVMYSGSVAGKQGLETFVEAAHNLRNEKGIKFLLVGEGPFLAELKTRAQEMQISNLVFLPLQSREGLPEQLAAADVLVITQKRAVTDIVFPGKLLYYMAAGRPILASVSPQSETGTFIVSKGIGVVTPPEDAEALATAIVRLRSEQGSGQGQRGRAVVEQYFDRKVVLPSFVENLETLTK